MSRRLFRVWISFIVIFSSSLKAESSSQSKAKWTFLIYMSADNDLEPASIKDLWEMEKVGSTEDVQIVVQWDGYGANGVDRFKIEKQPPLSHDPKSKETKYKRRSPTLESLPEKDMSDPEVLKNFLTWGQTNFPAQHFALIFWGHGSGWNKNDDPITRSIAFDDSSDSKLTNDGMRNVLEELHKDGELGFDLIIFDACSMGMMEVAHSLVGLSKIMVASEEIVPGDGLPYEDILNELKTTDLNQMDAVAALIVNSYNASYSSGSQGNIPVTMSALRIEKIPDLRDRLYQWFKALENSGLGVEQILAELEKLQSFSVPYNHDLMDYINLMYNLYRDFKNLKSEEEDDFTILTKEVKALISDTVSINSFNSSRHSKASGLAIYLPYNPYGESPWASLYGENRSRYSRSGWSNASLWSGHLNFLFY